MRVLVAGATGFIGTQLTRQLLIDGHEVLRLTRGEPKTADEYRWSPADLWVDPVAIEQADAVVNLAGAPTGRLPWTPHYKREILYSRVRGTQTIAEAIAASSEPPSVYLAGSAVGYYGDRPGEQLTEASTKGEGFLADVVEAWEQAADLTPTTTRLVKLRTGVVVGPGGAFAPLIPLTLLGLGARIGTGRQFWPWISLFDEAAAIRHLLTSDLEGVVNLAGPIAARSGEITSALARVLGRWHPWAVPTFALEATGDFGHDVLLADQEVVPERLEADGFEFRHRTINAAMSALAASR